MEEFRYCDFLLSLYESGWQNPALIEKFIYSILSIFFLKIYLTIGGNNNMKTYELSLTANYVSDWDFRMAMRELIQNGTDQEILDKNNHFSISYTNGTISLFNTRSTLKINTLLLGRSTKSKNDDTVGQFGEGYKIAALVLNRIGKIFTIYNHSKNEIWTTRFVNSRRWCDRILVFDVDEKKSEQQGLTIEVGNVSEEEWEELKETWLGFIPECSRIHTTYGDILTDENQKNRVYVNGLFISCSADLQYGYDFKPQYLKLERDRMSCDSFNAKNITGKMLNEAYENGDIDPSLIHEMIDDSSDDVSFLSYDASDSLKQGYLEDFDEAFQMADLKDKEIPEVLSKPIPVISQADYNHVESLGGNPVYVSYQQGDILGSARKERIKELQEYASAHNEDLTVYERLKLWHKRYTNHLPVEADEEFEEIMMLLK